MIVGAAEGLIISVITQPCLLIPGISRHRNTGDVVLVLHETLSGIWNVKNTACPKLLLVIVSAILRMGIWGKVREVLAAVLWRKGQKEAGMEIILASVPCMREYTCKKYKRAIQKHAWARSLCLPLLLPCAIVGE